jgi:curli production assembly/transport component CsgF
LAIVGTASSAPVQAQELVHRFINPSFGGNPFYSEHLRTIAGIHRPSEPQEPAEPVPTEVEQLVIQLQSSLNAQAQSEILDAIRTARPGQSGEFLLGLQRITFNRSTTETRVTFVNTETGETRVVLIPVPRSNAGSLSAGTTRSAEQALGGLGTVPNGPLSGSQSSGLLSLPPL